MDFKQIEAFVNVVRHKSFSKAADATFFTQPTISTHISVLEKELGTKLLDRRGRTIEMTPQGRQFYKYAVEMVNTRAKAIEEINAQSGAVEGILEIQSSSIPAITFLPELLSTFHNTYNKTQFYVDVSDTQTVISDVIDRRGEIGFIGEKPGGNNFDCVKVLSDNVVLVVPASYQIADEITLAEAVNYPFIWRESGSATRRSFEEAAAKHGFDKSEFEVVAHFNDLDPIIRSVEQGLGVSILSEYTVSKIGNSKVKMVRIKGFNVKRDFYMITLKGISLSPVAEAFRTFVEGTYDLSR